MNADTYFAGPDLYDVMYAGFVADIGVWVDEAKAAGGPVLDVCCGTGRLLLPVRESGAEIDGLDYDAPMLERLRERLAERRLTAGIHHADMRDFALPRRYALVYIGFNSFLHNLTQQDQLRTLVRCREHLAPGGHLALMCFHPSAARLAAPAGEPRLGIDAALPDGGRVRVYDAIRPDRVTQVNHVERRVERLDASGAVVETHTMSFRLRYIYTPEMELLLSTAGFGRFEARSPISGYGGERYATEHAPEDGGIHLWRASVS